MQRYNRGKLQEGRIALQEVYVDLYFLINTCMNLLALMITAALLHRRPPRWRAWLAAALGGAWAVLALFVGAEGFGGLLADGAVIFLMSVLVFATRGTTLYRLLQCTAVSVLTSLILGGTMTALYALLNRLDLPLAGDNAENSSLLIFLIIAILSGLATMKGGRFLGFAKKTRYVTVCAELFGNVVTLRALVDTGNLLREPISGRSVIVANRARILAVLPQTLAKALKSPSPETWLSDARYATRIRLIPTHTAAGEKMLPAIVPDKLTLTDGRETYPADYLIAPAPMEETNTDFDAVIAMN